MNKKQNEKIVSGMALFGAVALVGAFASNAIAQEPSADAAQTSTQAAQKCKTNQADVCIDIVFDSKGCPKKAIPDGEDGSFYIANSKKVIWQSIDDTPAGNPIDADYEIFFDPFKGQPLKSDGNGRVKAQFDPNAPADGSGIEYKYSIVGGSEECADKIHDPRFKVRS